MRDEQQPEPRVPRRRPAQIVEQVADRPRDAEAQPGARAVRHGDDDPVAGALGAGRVVDARHVERRELRAIGVVGRVEMPVLADGEGNLAAVAARVGEDRGEQVRQVDLGVDLLHDLAVALHAHVQLIPGERGLPRHRLLGGSGFSRRLKRLRPLRGSGRSAAAGLSRGSGLAERCAGRARAGGRRPVAPAVRGGAADGDGGAAAAAPATEPPAPQGPAEWTSRPSRCR